MQLQPIIESPDVVAARKRQQRKAAVEYVRALYVQERRLFEERQTGVRSRYGDRRMARWDGGVDSRTGRHYRMIWGRIFDYCVSHGYSVAEFIKAQFRDVKIVPQPNQLYGQGATARYAAVCSNRAADITELRQSLELQQQKFRVAVSHVQMLRRFSTDAACRQVLLYDNSLSRLFRYSIGVQAGDRVVQEAMHDGALLMYLVRRSEYREAWGDFIPAVLEQEAQGGIDRNEVGR